MDHFADVVVVGGGFAGSALAVLGGPRLTPQLGPDNVPAEAFDRPDVDRILALS